MLAAFDIYINYIKDPKDDELVGMKFLKANIYRRYNHFDKAIPLFEDILDKHREHETAEYSANLLLDTYNRMQKYDEMLALADKLDKDPKFLEGKDDLKATLDEASRRSRCARRPRSSRRTRRRRRTSASTSQCGQAYLDIYNRDPEATENDEVLYNAGVCFEEGRSIGAAIQMFNLLQKYYPNEQADGAGARSHRQGVRRHRVLRQRGGEARGVREEVRRREGRVRRDERRGVLPQGHRRRRRRRSRTPSTSSRRSARRSRQEAANARSR